MSDVVTLWRRVEPASGTGLVAAFPVAAGFLAKYRVEDAGSRAHREYPIPADDFLPLTQPSLGGSS